MRSMSDDQLEEIYKGASKLGVQQGETVIQQGELGDHFYVVESGVFEVDSPHSHSQHHARASAGTAQWRR